MTQSDFLGKEKISKLLFKFSIPCIASLLISALYNIVDQIFIGNSELGYLGNAATGVVFPILIITMAFSWCYGDGSAAYLSLCQGRNDTRSAHKCMGTMITLTFITSIVLMILFFIFEDPLLKIFGATEDVLDESGNVIIPGSIGLAKQYFKIIVGALVPYMLTNAMASVVRADGSPTYAMIMTLSGAIINIILDPVFIFGFDWGIEGAAYATIIGQFVSFVFGAYYFIKRTKSFKLTLKSLIPCFSVFKHALGFGVSTFITQLSIVAISLVCNIMLATYGAKSELVGFDANIPISAISIETKVFTVILNIVVGLILGAQPIIGYNYGAKRYGRVKETYKLVILLTLAVGIVSTLLIELCPQILVLMFGTNGSDPELYMNFAKMTFRIFLSLVTFTCFIKISSIFFQAVGRPVSAMISSLFRDIVFFIPLALILPNFFGLEGVLYASPIADIFAIIVAVTLNIKFFKHLNRLEKSSKLQ
ncbi:MAG: MATE family efflux transporter [Clostridia bacterium]|nr:MATE family efflux transporter [Clostridia bacterium]